MWHRNDAEGKFCRDTFGAGFGGGGSGGIFCLTASGTRLGSLDKEEAPARLQAVLKNWNALPEAERRPGAVKVGDLGAIDAENAPPEPPPGGLIIKTYGRVLTRD